jgi:hypothetical protein
MKFTNVVMNPPYGKLHLPILKKVIEEVVDKNDGQVVSLQPERWITDPTWMLKQKTDAQKMRPTLEGKIDFHRTLTNSEKELFKDASFTMDLGIFSWKKDGKLNYDDDFILNKDIINLVILKKGQTFIQDKISTDYTKGFAVHTLPLYGHGLRGNYWVKNFILDHGKYNGVDYKDSRKGNFETSGKKDVPVVIFKTKNEAQNYIDSVRTTFYKFLFLRLQKDVHTPLHVFPYMDDYTKPWTNERFYKYFKITKEQQKIIENTVKEYA